MNTHLLCYVCDDKKIIQELVEEYESPLEGAKAKCALRAGRSRSETSVAKFLLISLYFTLLPRLLEASGFLQRSDEKVISLFWVRVMEGNHESSLLGSQLPSHQGPVHRDHGQACPAWSRFQITKVRNDSEQQANQFPVMREVPCCTQSHSSSFSSLPGSFSSL